MHDGNVAYSDENNSMAYDSNGNQTGYYATQADAPRPKGTPGAWDVPYDEYGAFFGATISSVNNGSIKVIFSNLTNVKSEGAWANYSSFIPATSDVKLDAKLTNVALLHELINFYFAKKFNFMSNFLKYFVFFGGNCFFIFF